MLDDTGLDQIDALGKLFPNGIAIGIDSRIQTEYPTSTLAIQRFAEEMPAPLEEHVGNGFRLFGSPDAGHGMGSVKAPFRQKRSKQPLVPEDAGIVMVRQDRIQHGAFPQEPAIVQIIVLIP